jgi:peptide/bleomycin uptake transporter
LSEIEQDIGEEGFAQPIPDPAPGEGGHKQVHDFGK